MSAEKNIMIDSSITKGIAVTGLGFIGLPLALSFAMRGVRVVGIDVIPELIRDINAGVSHHLERYKGRSLPEILAEQLESGRFHATDDYVEASQAVDTYIVTVGIPVFGGVPDYAYLDGACQSIGSVLKKGDTVIIRSTVIPGTTEDHVLPILEEESGLVAGEDFHLAYASERIAEGRAFEEFENMPLAYGGVTQAAADRARDILTIVTKAEVTQSTIKTVETAKVVENIQRDVNIAMVQQFASFANKFGIDTNELIRVANTHTRVNLLTPGPGVGGYCLPNAFYYIEPKAHELGLSLDLLHIARIINDQVPRRIVERVEATFAGDLAKGNSDAANDMADDFDEWNEEKVVSPLKGKKIAVLGLAMKDYSNDDRISPPIDLVKILLDKEAKVAAYDQAVVTKYDFKHDNLETCLRGAEALIILTMQEEFRDYKWAGIIKLMLSQASPITVFDAKGVITEDILANQMTEAERAQVRLLKI